MHKCGIYVITNTVNGKRYVGSSVNIRKRWTRHRCELWKNGHHNKHIQAAWNKYGEAAFTFRVLAWLEKSELRDTEARLIKAWDLTNPDKGYNKTDNTTGTTHGKSPSLYTIAKIKARQTGRKHTPETKARMSATQRTCWEQRKAAGCVNKRHSAEANAQKSKRQKGRSPTPVVMEKARQSHLGKPRPQATRQKLREAAKAYYEAHPEAGQLARQWGAKGLETRYGKAYKQKETNGT